jgi:DDB1- and CUL4-associated factor 13
MPSHSPQKPHTRRLSNGLPQYSFAVQEKRRRQQPIVSWFIPVTITLPRSGPQPRTIKCWCINPYSLSRYGRKKGCLLMTCFLLFAFYSTFALTRRFGTKEKRWPRPPFTGHPPTLVFQTEDLQRIWLWEIASGHYPSRQPSMWQNYLS